jgi:DNA-binding MarR family transcriptional regulator/N-acetylglutamate synthase-like GNAT family acetyltransferase
MPTATRTSDETIATVRGFTRFYTRRIGVLQEALLESAFNLPEARLVYEIALRDRLTASDLAADLALDAGYLSRLLKGLEQRGYLRRRASDTDGRQQILQLTHKGRREFEQINARSDLEVRKLLDPLKAPERALLRSALATAERLLGDQSGKADCRFRDLEPGDIGWIVHRHAVLYAREYGWDHTFEAMVAKVGSEFIENFNAKCERAWIAELEGRIVGSVFLVKKSKAVAKLRLLYVEPDVRGRGIGRRLVESCIGHARKVGYERMTLWTNDVLTAARAIYEATGFQLVHSEPHHSFGKELIGETWERDL